MDHWKQYLLRSHSEATYRDWARRLRLFRFFRAYGGHANDGDSLDVAYRYDTELEMTDFLRWLGLQPVIHKCMPEQPVPGVPCQGDEFAQFPSLIPGTQWIEQPGHCQVSGIEVFIWCGRHDIKLSVGSFYVVTEDDVKKAEELERKLVNSPLSVIDPPFDTKHYICPKYYPEYFG